MSLPRRVTRDAAEQKHHCRLNTRDSSAAAAVTTSKLSGILHVAGGGEKGTTDKDQKLHDSGTVAQLRY